MIDESVTATFADGAWGHSGAAVETQVHSSSLSYSGSGSYSDGSDGTRPDTEHSLIAIASPAADDAGDTTSGGETDTTTWGVSGTIDEGGDSDDNVVANEHFTLTDGDTWNETTGTNFDDGGFHIDVTLTGGGTLTETIPGGSITGTLVVNDGLHLVDNWDLNDNYTPSGSTPGSADWSLTGTDDITISGGDSTTLTIKGGFTLPASGSGSASGSSSGSSSGSGGGTPTSGWTCTGSITGLVNPHDSFGVTVDKTLDSSEDWDLTGGGGGGGGGDGDFIKVAAFGTSWDSESDPSTGFSLSSTGGFNDTVSDNNWDGYGDTDTVDTADNELDQSGTDGWGDGGGDNGGYHDNGTWSQVTTSGPVILGLSGKVGDHGSDNDNYNVSGDKGDSNGTWTETDGGGGDTDIISDFTGFGGGGTYTIVSYDGSCSGTENFNDTTDDSGNLTDNLNWDPATTSSPAEWGDGGSGTSGGGQTDTLSYSDTGSYTDSSGGPNGCTTTTTHTTSEGEDYGVFEHGSEGLDLESDDSVDVTGGSISDGGHDKPYFGDTTVTQYQYAVDGGSVSGQENGTYSENESWKASDPENYSGGTSVDSPAATATDTYTLHDDSSYSGSGTYSGTDGGGAWSGTINEHGNYHEFTNYPGTYSLVNGSWVLTGGTGTESGSTDDYWHCSSGGAYTNGPVQGQRNYDYTDDATSQYGITASVANGQWQHTGTGSNGDTGDDDYTYNGSGTYTVGGISGTATESGGFNDDWGYSTNSQVINEQWVATDGSGGSSGGNNAHRTYTGGGAYQRADESGLTLSGTEWQSGNDDWQVNARRGGHAQCARAPRQARRGDARRRANLGGDGRSGGAVSGAPRLFLFAHCGAPARGTQRRQAARAHLATLQHEPRQRTGKP